MQRVYLFVYLWLFMIICDCLWLLIIICNYLWLFMIILLWYGNVVCINVVASLLFFLFVIFYDYSWLFYGDLFLLSYDSVVWINEGLSTLFFREGILKIYIIGLKTINEWYKQCKKLQIFIFSKKNQKIKKFKKWPKKVRWDPHLYILLKL